MAENDHNHPGQAEPRSYGQAHHHPDVDIDLNSASEDQLARLPMIGPERARDLVQRRPFGRWEDVEKVPGIGPGVIDDLKSGGARIGKS